jgi:hypothetical protein
MTYFISKQIRSLEIAGVYFINQLSLQLIQCLVPLLQPVPQLAVCLTLSERLLRESAGVSLKLASGGALGEKIAVAILDVLVRLAGPVV